MSIRTTMDVDFHIVISYGIVLWAKFTLASISKEGKFSYLVVKDAKEIGE